VGLGTSLLGALCVLTLPLASSAAQAQSVPLVDARLSSDLSRVLEEHLQQEPARNPRSVAGVGPAVCKRPLTPEH
jgi:hypothetical protein